MAKKIVKTSCNAVDDVNLNEVKERGKLTVKIIKDLLKPKKK